MTILPEKPFTIDGMKSPLHCIDINIKNPELYSSNKSNYHYHDYIELLFSLDSDIIVWIKQKSYKFQNGDLIIINSNDIHNLIFLKPSHYIVVKITPESLFSNTNSLFELKYILPFLKENSYKQIFTQANFNSVSLHESFKNIMTEWNEQKPAYELAIRSIVLKIFTEIFRYWSTNTTSPIKFEISDMIKSSIVYMTENYDTATEKSVAKYCGYSCNYFSHIFKKAVGKNFHDYIIEIKLREAEKKLVSTNDSITEIAVSSGFSSSSHFISHFKKLHGITPYKFKKKHISMS